MWVATGPTFARAGVVAGFTLGVGSGRVPTITPGVLWAQGQMFRPGLVILPAAPANQQSWLFYNFTSGFYWKAGNDPNLSDDAALGWVVTNATQIVTLSGQQIWFEEPEGESVPLGPVMAQSAGEVGDVRPADFGDGQGVQPFKVTISDLENASLAVDFEYDPPDPVWPFTGVFVAYTPPDGQVRFSEVLQYTSISEANRHGLARFTVPTPVQAEDWRFALVSVSATSRNTYYPPTAGAGDYESPNRLVHVVAGTLPSGGGPVADAPAVTPITVGSDRVRVVSTALGGFWWLNFAGSIQLPADLGTLAQVEVACVYPDGTEAAVATIYPGAAGTISLFQTPKWLATSPATFALKFYSVNTDGKRTMSTVPSVGGLVVDAAHCGTATAPDLDISGSNVVLNGIMEYRKDAGWVYTTALTFARPADLANYNGVNVFRQWVGKGRAPEFWQYSPKEQFSQIFGSTDAWPWDTDEETLRFWFQPLNGAGVPNPTVFDANATPHTPYKDLVLRKADYGVTTGAARQYVELVTITSTLQRQATAYDADGHNVYGFEGACQTPLDKRLGGVWLALCLCSADGSIKTNEAVRWPIEQPVPIGSDPGATQWTFSFTTDLYSVNDQTSYWKAFFVCQDTNGNRNPIVDGVTPGSELITVSPGDGRLDLTRSKPNSFGRMLVKDPITGQPRVATDNIANLLADPGFEFGGDKWTQSGTVSFVTGPVQTGTRAAKLQGAYTTLIQNISCRPGDTYYVEEYLAADTGTNGLGRIYLQPLDAALAWVGTGVYADAGAPPAAGTWVKISKSITTPAGASYLSIWVWVLGNSAGAWYCDNVYAAKVTTGDEIALGDTLDKDANGNVVVKAGSLTEGFLTPKTLGGDLGKWVDSKKPVGIYNGLPTLPDATVPEVIFNTSTGKLYRKNGTVWSAAVDPGDLVAGNIASGVIMTGRLLMTLNGVTVAIENALDSTYGQYAGVRVQQVGSNARALISYGGMAVINSAGYRTAELSDGYIVIRDANGNITAQIFGAGGLVSCQSLSCNGFSRAGAYTGYLTYMKNSTTSALLTVSSGLIMATT